MIVVLVGYTLKTFLEKSSAAPRLFPKKFLGTEEEVKWQMLSTDEILSLAATQSMFGGEQVYVLADAINSDKQEEFLDIAKELVDSPNTFIFEEEKLLKGPTTVLEKAGAEIVLEKTLPTGRQGPAAAARGFDPFGLTSALASRDRKKLWLGLMNAFKAGEKAEAVAGLLNWKIRQELERATGAKRQDLIKLSRKLVFMYHDSHRGAGDLELLLERFALSL